MTNVCILCNPVLQNLNSDTKEQYTTSYSTCSGQVRPERLVWYIYSLLYLTPYFRPFSHFWLITGFVTRLTRWGTSVELELLLFLEHLSSSPVFSGVGVTPYLVICVFFCRSLFVLLYFFFWPLCCLFFFDIRVLITPLVSSNSC